MAKLVYVELDDSAARALRTLADQELREPRKQASILIRDGLRRAGVLIPSSGRATPEVDAR